MDSSCRSSPARCTSCDQPFSASDLVIRVHLHVFHSSCFSCCVCRSRFSRGDQFALVDTGLVYCRADYERRHSGSVLDCTAAPDARRLDVDGDGEELERDDGVSPESKDALSPSGCRVRIHCRRSWRTRKLTPPVHQNVGKTKLPFYLLTLTFNQSINHLFDIDSALELPF